MTEAMLKIRWATAFPGRSRPKIYSISGAEDGDVFRPLADATEFLVDNLQRLTQTQLYSLTENNAEALRLAQQEWLELERIAQQIKSHDHFPVVVKDPQQLPSREVFEERKEAILYGYKYEANRKMLPARFTVSEQVSEQEKFDCREPPEPFAQAGLIPNEKQFKAIIATAKTEGREENPDKQESYLQNFALEDRPEGVWIAKTLPLTAPPPPRTRAREAILNGTNGDRQTRFNGEKVPMTRQMSSNTVDTASPSKRNGTPLSGQSPATLGKRKIDAIDITGNLPRKKHANQYTKQRERDDQAAWEISHSQNDIAPSVTQVKKKHPNQYTKRREREEQERRERDEVESQMKKSQTGFWDPAQPHLQREHRFQHDPYRVPSMYGQHQYYAGNPLSGPRADGAFHHFGAHLPSRPERSLERPKHPNQHTKRREREAAAASQQAAFHQTGSLSSQQMGYPVHATQVYGVQQSNGSRQVTPTSLSVQAVPLSKKGDPSTMSREELRLHLFKDDELIRLLKHDHLWLNDDVEQAANWKTRILNSDYPVRTWAMLRKWKEWKAEGKDKRPRDRDGNRIKQTQPTIAVVPTSSHTGGNSATTVTSSAAVKNEVTAAPLGTIPPAPSTSSPPPRQIRSFRNRLDVVGSNLAGSHIPRSPLANGINSRDLDRVGRSPPSPSTKLRLAVPSKPSLEAQSTAFSNSLQALNELDPTTKVHTWQNQNKTETELTVSAELVTSDEADDAQNPRYTRQPRANYKRPRSTPSEDMTFNQVARNDWRSSPGFFAETTDSLRRREPSSVTDESNHSSTSSESHFDSQDKDGDYGAPVNRRARKPRAATAKHRLVASNSAVEKFGLARSTRSSQAPSLLEPVPKCSSRTASERIATGTASRGMKRATRSERTASPAIVRRSGLRPNPPKRMLTEESEVTGTSGEAATGPTRRSARTAKDELSLEA